MTNLSSLLGLSSSKTSGYRQVLLIRSDPRYHDLKVVHPDGVPVEAPPMFTIKTGMKPDVLVHRGGAVNGMPVATASIGKRSTELFIRGSPATMTRSSMSSKTTLECGLLGRFVWRMDQDTYTYPELRDAAGTKLAAFKKNGTRLEILVPCDEFFLDIVVVSALVVNAANGKGAEGVEAAAEIVGAVLGAA